MKTSNKQKRIDWWLLITLAIVSAGLGMYGFHIYSIEMYNRELSLADLAYRTLQLFTFESGAVNPPVPLTLEIARWMALFVTFFAIIKSIISLLRRQSQTLFRLRTLKRHVIICGLSNKGLHIAQEWIKRGQRLVIIDPNPQHIHLSELNRQGAIHVIGDPRDPAILERAKIATARYLFAITDDDASNISVIHAAHRVIHQDTDSTRTMDCYAHVADQTTKTLFYDNALFSESSKRFNAQLFNLYDRGARLLLESYAPDCTREVRSTSDPVVSILVFGSSPLATSVMLHAARIGHYVNDKKLSITLDELQASDLLRSLRLTTPALEEIIDIHPVDHALEELTTQKILAFLENKPDAVYVCAKSDAQAIALARRLHPLAGDHSAPIVATLHESNVLTQLLCEEQTDTPQSIHLFSLIKNTLSLDQILNAKQDNAARLIHQMYCDDQFSQGETQVSNRSLVPWDDLSESMKDSNRGQADHLPIKLRAVGLQIESVMNNPSTLRFTEDQITLLSDMEHRRWMADKKLNGWRATDGEKNARLKLNPLLVDYELLPESEKHKDRQTILTISKLLETMKTDEMPIRIIEHQVNPTPCAR